MNQVLAYHSVCPRPADQLSVSSQEFEKQVTFLIRNGYEIVSLARYVAAKEAGKVPRNWIVLTFDDGFSDFLDHAFPILQRYNVPATVFLISGYISENRMTKGKFSYLSVEDIEVLKKSGLVSFGSHTISHSHLSKLSASEVLREMVGSKSSLEKLLGFDVETFCYPAGRHSSEVMRAAFAARYRWVFLTPRSDQTNYLESQGRVVLRTGIYCSDGMLRFKMKISSLFRGYRAISYRFSRLTA